MRAGSGCWAHVRTARSPERFLAWSSISMILASTGRQELSFRLRRNFLRLHGRKPRRPDIRQKPFFRLQIPQNSVLEPPEAVLEAPVPKIELLGRQKPFFRPDLERNSIRPGKASASLAQPAALGGWVPPDEQKGIIINSMSIVYP